MFLFLLFRIILSHSGMFLMQKRLFSLQEEVLHS